MLSSTSYNNSNNSTTDESNSENSSEQVYELNNISKIFSNKELCYYVLINNFFMEECSKEHIEKMISIINTESNISLRVLDWFVTKYSRKHSNFESLDETFDVRISYKAQLKSFRKKYFDPFRRRKKFIYSFERKDIENLKILTTLGQLNFFRWAITKNILDYVEKNLNEIILEMNNVYKIDKKIKNKKNSNKELHINAKKSIENNEMKIILYFD